MILSRNKTFISKRGKKQRKSFALYKFSTIKMKMLKKIVDNIKKYKKVIKSPKKQLYINKKIEKFVILQKIVNKYVILNVVGLVKE